MTKRLNSKYRICKSLNSTYKNLWGLKKKNSLNCLLKSKINKKRVSVFGKLLNVKKSLKSFYSNIRESSFKNYINFSVKSPAKTIDKFISILESRLDSVLYRGCFVKSFHEARQLINHNYVYINGVCTNVPDKKVYYGDVIELRKKLLNQKCFAEVLLTRSIPNYLEVDFKISTIIFLWDSNFKNVYYPIKTKYWTVNRFYK